MEKYPGLTVSNHGIHVLVFLALAAFNEDGRNALIVGEQGDYADRRGLYARSGGGSRLHIFGEAADAVGLVAGQRGIDGEAEEALPAESELDVFQVVEGAREQGGGNQQQQRKRNLRDDQGFP